jgi:hypothetical protein
MIKIALTISGLDSSHLSFTYFSHGLLVNANVGWASGA